MALLHANVSAALPSNLDGHSRSQLPYPGRAFFETGEGAQEDRILGVPPGGPPTLRSSRTGGGGRWRDPWSDEALCTIPRMRKRPDLVLVGCVKSKRTWPGAARDLYDSPLWRCRRRYAEQSGVPWFILSAEHGLLPPETRIRCYDTTLATFAASERQKWSRRVLSDLRARFLDIFGKTVEIHAGKLYFDHGLADGLREAGAIVHLPLSGVVGIGAQCRWYGEQSGGDTQLGEKE